MRNINCVVADDETLAREVIQNHIGKLDNLSLIATCANGIETYTALKTKPVDLLFLDIQMPQLSGIALLKTLNNPPAVIITTAYREFALEGYELDVIDYLLKPVSFERFLKGVDKYVRRTGVERDSLAAPLQLQEKGTDPGFIYVKADKKMIRILLKDIVYLEGLKDYVKIHTLTAGIITYQTLNYFNEKLPAHLFIRVHRSYIVGINHLTAYTATRIEVGKTDIPIGGAYAKDVSSKLSV